LAVIRINVFVAKRISIWANFDHSISRCLKHAE
jgi:hypothetical protein